MKLSQQPYVVVTGHLENTRWDKLCMPLLFLQEPPNFLTCLSLSPPPPTLISKSCWICATIIFHADGIPISHWCILLFRAKWCSVLKTEGSFPTSFSLKKKSERWPEFYSIYLFLFILLQILWLWQIRN